MKELDVDSYVPSRAKDQFHDNLLPAGIRPQKTEITTGQITPGLSAAVPPFPTKCVCSLLCLWVECQFQRKTLMSAITFSLPYPAATAFPKRPST
jgi:hypothetical protein